MVLKENHQCDVWGAYAFACVCLGRPLGAMSGKTELKKIWGKRCGYI